ncbi:MAG: glycosyltransferase [Candidatus Wildermuthbacteria bacterium]|nr:glycosyltransferase [Candidatus Wildermuthbacteria bacterium]
MALKIRVTFFLSTLEFGGAERITINLIQNLHPDFFDIVLLVKKRTGDFQKEIPSYAKILDLHSANPCIVFWKLVRYFRSQQPDIFISHFTYTNLLATGAKICAQAKTKLILTEHTPFSQTVVDARSLFRKILARWVTPSIMKMLYPKADMVVCVSQGVAQDLKRLLAPKACSQQVIYSPIVGNSILQFAQEEVSHPWFQDVKSIPIVLSVGRMIRAKDYPTLLKAFQMLRKKRSVRLILIGEGPERKKLEHLARELDISKDTAFAGFQRNPYAYMKRSTLFVLSSIREGFPTALVEAMACGVPVVSTDCNTGPREIIRHGENGFLVSVKDAQGLAGALEILLNSTSLQSQFSIRGRERAQDFSIEKSMKSYEYLFQKLVQS